MCTKMKFYCYLLIMTAGMFACSYRHEVAPAEKVELTELEANARTAATTTYGRGREDIIKDINFLRGQAKLPPLKMDERLNNAAYTLVVNSAASRQIVLDRYAALVRQVYGYNWLKIGASGCLVKPTTPGKTNSNILLLYPWAKTPDALVVFNNAFTDIGVSSKIVNGLEYFVFIVAKPVR